MSMHSFDFASLREWIHVLKEPVARVPAPENVSTRQERLDSVLQTSCLRGGFSSLALCDAAGLPLAVQSDTMNDDRLAGLTAVLGEALERVCRLWDGPAPETMSIDIDYSDKLVFRIFRVDDRGYALLGICPQERDERGEMELTVGEVTGIISSGRSGG